MSTSQLAALRLAARNVAARAVDAWSRSRLAAWLHDLEVRFLIWHGEHEAERLRDAREVHLNNARIAAIDEHRVRREVTWLRIDREIRTERIAPSVLADWDPRR